MESYDISSPAFESDALPSKPRRPRRRVAIPTPTDTHPDTAAADETPAAPSPAAEQPATRQQEKPRQQRQAPQPAKPIPGGSRQKAETRKRASDNPSQTSAAIKQAITDGRVAMFIGIILLVVAAYLTLAFVSYIANGADDQSAVHSYAVETLVDGNDSIRNIAGPLGASIAEKLISGSFGIGSSIIIFYLIMLGLALTGTRKCHFVSLTLKSIITMVSLSVVLGMVSYATVSTFFWGGAHGHYVNQLLYQSTGVFGMIGVSIVLVSAIVLIFLKQIAVIFGRIKDYIAEVRARREARRVANIAEQIDRETREAKAKDEHPEEAAEEEPTAPTEQHKPNDSVELPPYDDPYDDMMSDELDDDPDAAIDDTATPVDRQPYPEQSYPRTAPASDPAVAPADPRPVQPQNHYPTTPVTPTTPATPVTPAPQPQAPAAYDAPREAVRTEPAKVEKTNEVTVSAVAAPPIEEAEDEGPELYDPTAELRNYRKPPLDLMEDRPVKVNSVDEQEQEENKNRITRVLNSFGIEITKIDATVGPTITLYEIVPAEGVRISKIKTLEDDIALNLAAKGIRIIAPMPGRGTIGIEVPNKDAQIVSIRNVLASKKFQETTADLPLAMGATISNEVYIADLCKMPHLLVAGTTGTGKSVGLNTIIASLLYKKHPAEVKFVLVDPKMVEFALYNRIERHYLAKLPDESEAIITNMDKVVPTLESLCTEMDNRYELLKKANVRNIKEYNEKFIRRRLSPENGHQYLPYIVMIIDEFADLIMTAGKDVETPIARIAQKARAVGIHIILATQRPSANIITGVIRANFPGRIAFKVTTQLESRIILDRGGANQLIGRGDMLFSRDGSIERVQCALIETEEVEHLCDWISDQIGYEDAYLLPEYVPASEGASSGGGEHLTDRDPLFEASARLVMESGVGSTTALQRRFNIGFPRAGKIMDQLETAGIVGPTQGGKPRQVLMQPSDLERYLEICGGNS